MVIVLKDEIDRYRSSISWRMIIAFSEGVTVMSGDVAVDTEVVIRNMNMVLSRIIENRFLSFNSIFPPKLTQVEFGFWKRPTNGLKILLQVRGPENIRCSG
jgi:hypothetical protein